MRYSFIRLLLLLATCVMSMLFCGVSAMGRGEKVDYSSLPRTIESGPQDKFHVQGVAVDLERGYVYYSFTTSLLKTDLNGRVIGSVDGMTGHLGCISINPADGRVYGSIEYKHDAIGSGILKNLDGADNDAGTAFYVAIFDVDKIDRPAMNAETDGVMTTVYIKEAVDDYNASVVNSGRKHEHAFGCSGIDGLTFAPEFGKKKSDKPLLYVAYGVYGDTTRTDNDYQVLLAYDAESLKPYESLLSHKKLHTNGPDKPKHKYFVRTGNTSWGIQNLAYDKASGNTYAAVYAGNKSVYPNYTYFVIDGSKSAKRQMLDGFDDKIKGEVLSLYEAGEYDEAADVWGWRFPYGTTGLCPIGDGYFYISHNFRDPQTSRESSTLHLYKWTGNPDKPFVLVD